MLIVTENYVMNAPRSIEFSCVKVIKHIRRAHVVFFVTETGRGPLVMELGQDPLVTEQGIVPLVTESGQGPLVTEPGIVPLVMEIG